MVVIKHHDLDTDGVESHIDRNSDLYKKYSDKIPKEFSDYSSLNDFIADMVVKYNEVNKINHELRNKNHEIKNKIDSISENLHEKEIYINELNTEISRIRALHDRELYSVQTEYKDAILKLNQEKERYSETYQEKIKESADLFLDSVVDSLVEREGKLNKFAICWSFFGALCLIGGVVLVYYFSKSNIENFNVSWQGFLYYCVRGLGVIGIIGFLSRYAFMQSGNFMKEALRTDDRIHNIRFGQLYIVTYGAAAEWKEVKEALSNWNGKTKQDWKQKIKFEELTQTLNAAADIYRKNEAESEKKGDK